jgi:hypothetical protein
MPREIDKWRQEARVTLYFSLLTLGYRIIVIVMLAWLV